jgi:predicted Zn finger-like uncharacterized protein
MHVKCPRCRNRHSVTDETIRADRISIKCRDCDTVVYFKNPPPAKIEPARIKKGEPLEPIIMPHDVPDIKETREEEKYTKPASTPARKVQQQEYRKAALKVPLPETKKTDTTSPFQSVFDNIAEKLEKMSEDKNTQDFDFLRNINLKDKATIRVILFVVGGIFLIWLIDLIFTRI